ncbi:hypothetical protein TrST_g3708 [Triparma strigata]|uniref:Uncharacterized protein n=1 Tax=Triparma strigata TaxID=1606541 RepID=A0A9W6ZIB6_9STRA|nr:hypothetical protein TrST_g3708 [Triparma strigata]
MVSDSLVIPLTKTSPGETVEIFPSELSATDPSDILSLLESENASPELYFQCAVGYHRQNLPEEHDQVCQAGIKLDQSLNMKTEKDKEALMSLYCSLASSRITSAERLKQSSNLDPSVLKAKIEEIQSQAQDLFTQADKIDQFYSTTWCSKGRMLLSQYNKKASDGVATLERAKYYFETSLRESGRVLPALMGMANVMYLEGHFQKALNFYAEAIKNFPEESGSEARVALGMCCYKLGQVDRAYACFQRAISIDPANVSGRVGVGVLRMRSGEREAVEEGVKHIVRARINDTKNPMVNNHLANHFFYAFSPHPGTLKFGSHNKRKAKATAGIEVEVGDEVRIGLDEVTYVTAVNQSAGEIEFEDEVKTSGEQKWYKKDYSKVEEYAKTAFGGTTVPSIQAESCWLIGRVSHVRKEFDQAEKLYKNAVKLDQAFTPALYGYAQILVRKKDYIPACTLLENVLKACPNSPDALGLYGAILAKDGNKRAKALESLKRAVELKPEDANVHLMYATVLKNNVVDFPTALEAYQKSMDITLKASKPVSSSTLSNVGVLNFWRKEYDDAEKKLIEAIAAEGVVWEGVKSTGDIIAKGGDAVVPSIFNLARLYEEKGKHEDAVAIHREIINAHPAYTNSYVRMATISRDLGAMKHCAAWLEQAFATATDNQQLMCLIGHFWFDNKEFQNSQHIYEKLLNEGSDTMHPYANVALGNIYFASIGLSNGEKRGKFLKYSEDYYVKALQKDSGNVYAGNGIGCVLAEKGELSKARNVFQRVRECSNDSIPSTLLNMAHLMLAQQQHAPAIVLYRNYLEQNHAEAGSINVHLYISHAYYDWAKASEATMKTAMTEEAARLDERYRNSLDWLVKAKAIDPESKRCSYNEALVRQDFAVAVLKKGTEGLKRSLEDVEGAMVNLTTAKEIFTTLSEVDKESKPKPAFPVAKCTPYAEYCSKQITLCEQHLAHEQERAEEDKKKRESQINNAKLLAQEKILEKLKEEQRLAEEEERARKMAEENAEKIKTMTGQWNSAQKSKRKSEGKKGKKNPNAMEDDSDSSSDDEAVPVAGEVKETSVDALFGGSDSDSDDDDVPKPMETEEEEEAAPPKKKTGVGALFDSDSDDDSDAGGGGGEGGADGGEEPSAKKRKVIADDDDE